MPKNTYGQKLQNAEITAKNLRVHKDLHIPPSSSVLELPSKKYSLDGHTIIRVDLRDEGVMWDLKKFRQLEKNTSWYKEEGIGSMPTVMFIVINAAQTAVNIYDARDMSLWMAFIDGSSYLISGGSGTVTGLKFLDGVIYTGGPSQGFHVTDFVNDNSRVYTTSGVENRPSNLAARNTSLARLVMNSSPAMVHATVNAVAAIRDPLGAVDAGTGRPLHRIAVATAGGVSVSDAGIANIYDQSVITGEFLAIEPSGVLVYHQNWSTRDYVSIKNIQTVSADGWASDAGSDWINNGGGSREVPWGDSAAWTDIGIIEGASVARAGDPIVVISSDEGLAISHTKKGDNAEDAPAATAHGANGLTFIINAVGNWPPSSGTFVVGHTIVDAWAMEDVTGLFGKTLTSSGGGVTFGAGVIGSCATFDGTDYLKRISDSDFGTGTPGEKSTILLWIKSATDSISSQEYIIYITDRTSESTQINFEADGTLRWRMAGGGNTIVNPSIDLYDGLWHHVACLADGTSLILYVDGVLVGSTTNVHTSTFTQDEMYVGADLSAGQNYNGSVDQLSIIHGKALGADEIRFLYERGKRALQSSVNANDALDSANITAVSVDQDGEWIGVLDSSSKLTILDKYGIPYLEDDASIGTVDDIEVWTEPGSSEPSYAMAGSTGIKVVQQNANIYDAI